MDDRQSAWSRVEAAAMRLSGQSLPDLVAGGSAEEFSQVATDGLLIDFRKQRLDADAWTALMAYAKACALPEKIAALLSEHPINSSENRAALHWAIRSPDLGALSSDMRDYVRAGTVAADAFAEAVRTGEVKGSGGQPFRNIVHVGIGGSDFGPRLLADAFHKEQDKRFTLRFAANIDPLDIELALEDLDPAETLVVGVSKSFSTQETLYNLTRARDWLRAGLETNNVSGHIALVTAKPDKARDWAGGDVTCFHLPDEIGGRYSIWSAAGLSCAITLGPDIVKAFRDGASAMDRHVATASLADSLPARLAMLDVWNASALGETQRVLLCYARRLRLLPTYLQQLEMESNGKSVGPDGVGAPLPTAASVWGGEGTIGQHSYHQWLHQGRGAPAEFLLALDEGADPLGQRGLSANAIAQARALLQGRSLEDVQAELGADADPALIAQKVIPGDRPSTFMIANDFTPETLGKLVALYEHRTFCAGMLWGLNPFDQWGVELGKVMASGIEANIASGSADDHLDLSSKAILSALRISD